MLNEYLPLHPSLENCSFCLFLYLFMVIMSVRWKRPHFNMHVNTRLGWFFIFVFFLFSFYNDDWFSYFNHVSSSSFLYGNAVYLSGGEAMERVYFIIALALDGNYLLWRTIVFGSVALLTYFTAKRLKLNQYCFYFSFVLIAVPILSYARASLAMALAFWGLSLLICPLRSLKYLSYLLGCIVIGVSVFFHKSALILPVVVLGAYFFKITKLRVAFLLIAMLFLLYVLNNTNFINVFLGGDDIQYLVNERIANKYLNKDVNRYGGIAQFSIRILFWLSYYLFALLSLLVTWKGQLKNEKVLPYANSVIIIVFFSSIFLFVSNFNSFTLFYRFINFASIPISITASYCISRNIQRNFFLRATFLCLCSNILSIIYSTYSAYIHY